MAFLLVYKFVYKSFGWVLEHLLSAVVLAPWSALTIIDNAMWWWPHAFRQSDHQLCSQHYHCSCYVLVPESALLPFTFCFCSGINKIVETPGTWGIQTGSVDSFSNISSKDWNVLLLRCLHPSLDHEFMPFWQQLSTTNITILCLSFKVKYSAAFKCNAGAPTGSELSIR